MQSILVSQSLLRALSFKTRVVYLFGGWSAVRRELFWFLRAEWSERCDWSSLRLLAVRVLLLSKLVIVVVVKFGGCMLLSTLASSMYFSLESAPKMPSISNLSSFDLARKPTNFLKAFARAFEVWSMPSLSSEDSSMEDELDLVDRCLWCLNSMSYWSEKSICRSRCKFVRTRTKFLTSSDYSKRSCTLVISLTCLSRLQRQLK